jgi:predicted permease
VVSQSFFQTMGTRFALGGAWPVTGNEQDCTSQAVVSGAYWRRLGGSIGLGSNALDGKTLNLDGRDFQIAGVLPVEQEIEGSYALNQPEVFLQIGCDAEERPTSRGSNDFELIGRLKPEVTVAVATADLARVDGTLAQDYPEHYGSAKFRRWTLISPYLELVVGAETKPALLMTFAACGLLLAIACANLANLLLARNTGRRGEFATRATLGATAAQLLQQLMVEGALLVGLGAAGGIGLALFVLKVLKTATGLHLPRLGHASISLSVLAFTIAVSAVVTLALTVLPAWRSLRPGLLQDVHSGRASGGRSLRFAGRMLVVAQVMLTMVLVACSGWMVGGVYLLLHQPLGFVPDRLLMAQVDLGPGGTSEELARKDLKLTEIAASLRQLPGVQSAALTDHPPLGHAVNRYAFCSDMHPEQCRQQVNVNPNSYDIGAGYFSTIGQSLLAGRDFNVGDDGRNHVVIVNQALAAREWPGESALGHRIQTGEIQNDQGMSWDTVVGVVGNVHNYDLVSAPGPDLYIPRAEHPGWHESVVLGVSGDAASVAHAARARLKVQFPDASVGFETMDEEMSSEVSERVFLMRVAIAFGAVALFLAILGTYGLLAYEVWLREKEIGIRLALGSSRERIVALLLHEEGRWLVVGTALGLVCAVATGSLFHSRFYGADSTSTAVLLGSAAALLGPALLAIALPARRAAHQDPAETLRRD